ncbi:unnamed protein product [Amoebophrya sp. A25]|nr:unnamed protein product [Amoebophrya sp. A25]|eukprot:GSA25T00024735001.1
MQDTKCQNTDGPLQGKITPKMLKAFFHNRAKKQGNENSLVKSKENLEEGRRKLAEQRHKGTEVAEEEAELEKLEKTWIGKWIFMVKRYCKCPSASVPGSAPAAVPEGENRKEQGEVAGETAPEASPHQESASIQQAPAPPDSAQPDTAPPDPAQPDPAQPDPAQPDPAQQVPPASPEGTPPGVSEVKEEGKASNGDDGEENNSGSPQPPISEGVTPEDHADTTGAGRDAASTAIPQVTNPQAVQDGDAEGGEETGSNPEASSGTEAGAGPKAEGANFLAGKGSAKFCTDPPPSRVCTSNARQRQTWWQRWQQTKSAQSDGERTSASQG